MPSWRLTAEQFAATWLGAANDRMPFPFRFTSVFPFADEYNAFRAKVRRELATDEHEALRNTLRLLSEPLARIEVYGYKDGDEIRMTAARGPGNGVVAVQIPGAGGGDVTLGTFSADELTAAVVAELPPIRPGSTRAQYFTRTELENVGPVSLVRPDDKLSPSHRYRALVDRPTRSSGTIACYTGPRSSEQQTAGRARWYDVEDDGYYIETASKQAVEIKPVGAQEVRTLLDRWIENAVAMELRT